MKAKAYVSALTLLVTLLVASSCGDDGTRPSLPAAVGDFPNQIGFTWTYEVQRNLGPQVDTVVAAVARHTTLPNGASATVWRWTSETGTDSQYVSIVGDTVRVIPDLRYSWVSTKYVFPLRVGSVWCGDSPADSNRVVERDTVSVPAGTFLDGYLIEEAWQGPNYHLSVSSWFVPGIGLAWSRRSEYDLGPMGTTTMTLIDYSLVPR